MNIPTQVIPIVDTTGRATNPWWSWFTGLSKGISVTVALAPLTGIGTQGTLTVVNGIITAYTPPT